MSLWGIFNLVLETDWNLELRSCGRVTAEASAQEFTPST